MDVALAVGGASRSLALDVLVDRLSEMEMFVKHKHHAQILKLKSTLLGLQAVLSYAENKQASNHYVRRWLNELRYAVESAENLIEEVNYEALRLKVEDLAETSNQQVSDDFFLKIKKKLKKTIKTLNVLRKQIGRLGLEDHFGSINQQPSRTLSCALGFESDVFGRHKEIKDLIDSLLSEDPSGRNLTVVPIVGMGGVGKTTLTQMVFNHERVKCHFGLKAWYCFSEPYDALRITKQLLQCIGSFDWKIDGNLNVLQIKLKESLKGKKFLIVLDDVWNENYNEWYDLRNLFVQGDMGSKIIVTTRKQSVAQMMCDEKMDLCAITLGPLPSDDSWALFKRHSLDYWEHPAELEEVGKKIAENCKGLPLTLRTVAGLLRFKSEVDEWMYILKSQIWNRPRFLDYVLPSLMLSYNDLHVYLKRCFAFCAIYPKGYEFCKYQVIYLWIANGLVSEFQLGNMYFNELLSVSLFEKAPESKWKPERFLMHDLVNDMAQLIGSSRPCMRLEESEGSYLMEQDGDFEKRTLLPINISCSSHLSKRVLHNILPRLTCLRALSLSHYKIKELSNDLFVQLKLLKFLDLSWTHIEKLPDSVCVLYNLQTLLLSHCVNLGELPPQMEKLINLCHLDISNSSLLKMSLHLSKLKCLHVLVGAKFLLGGHGGLRMEDLGEVHNLYGSLSILELQNVVDKTQALKANIKGKKNVEKLSLEWSASSTADNSQTERAILDGLCPYTNIKELQITGYRGTKFSDWLADPSFLKLVELSLCNCKDCDSLPALGQLPSLKFLSIRKMHGIIEVTGEFYGSSSCKKPFNSLEKLEFEDMGEWKQWHVLGVGEFPMLEKLSIKNCPKLMGKLPENLCSLTELRISETPLFEEMKQIVELYIGNCNSLTSLPFRILPSTLKRMRITGCRELKLDPPVDEMSYCNMFLEDLNNHDELHSLGLWHLTSLQSLDIWNCRNLQSLSESVLPSSISELTIKDCPNLQSLPVKGMPSSLSKLVISNCPLLTPLLEFNKGKYWSNISQIPSIEIDEECI
ncbi:hypothetical protein MTR67_048879 [Solanum verrucosum]|uniref:Uncharacterized protein n=1 Tax=Solanum verrucosum TaxID=315347 RepID=A0AAF0V1F9_SOLVR|nr:putative disease resistance RPP13-like protein 1 [Solanum verrucosum]WMV55494.1 hypothetical protein MTR67_048879 [Solanum verrucosum]